MSPSERLHADYRTTGLTAGRHPMALLRPHLPELWRACDLRTAPHGTRLLTGGAVICRQRPGTAKGTLFLSLEDETGISNIIVHADLFERRRLLIIEEPSLIIDGTIQLQDGVLHVKAHDILPMKFQPITNGQSHDFR